MSKLKHVIIGVGAGVLGMHRPALELDRVELVGVTDVNKDLGQHRADEFKCLFFADHLELLQTTKPDIAVILAPHPLHMPLAIDAMRSGAHVLVEKPMAVEISEADKMIAVAQQTGKHLVVNFQQRFRPEIQKAQQLLSSGQLGRLQHVDMLVNWFRPKAYFQSSPWRATWRGEGGGVLMNQAPHNLDVICYLLGMPRRLSAWTRTNLHAIEVEDTVQAMLEWESGCLGSLHTSTAEAGREERLEIVGTSGVMRLSQGSLKVNLFELPLEQFALESKNLWDEPRNTALEITLPESTLGHVEVYKHLHRAILDNEPLLISGHEGRKSLELANAMLYSSHTGQTVTLPLDSSNYHQLLEGLKAGRV